jgi:hypothetical protein
MGMDDHYATLRVAPDADGRTIRAAYRALMRRYHPDVNGSRGAGARAKAINEAYACLRDPERRARYDRDRAAGVTSPPPQRKSSPPPPPPDMSWVVADVGGWRRPRLGRPTWWQVLGLGGATIATAITFTATSATPSITAPSAVIYMRMVEPMLPQPGSERHGDRAKPATE